MYLRCVIQKMFAYLVITFIFDIAQQPLQSFKILRHQINIKVGLIGLSTINPISHKLELEPLKIKSSENQKKTFFVFHNDFG